MPNTFSPRFDQLYAESDTIATTERSQQVSSFSSNTFVDIELLKAWSVKVSNLIANACGKDSEHYRQWVATYPAGSNNHTRSTFRQLRAVLSAARDDYNGGHLASYRAVVQSEIFSTELEQAQELLITGYKAPAAVIAGVVLETSLRELCGRAGLTQGKLDRMNADLAKAGTYNLLRQKQVTAMAQIRNDAAHGRWDQFVEADVKTMITDVGRFIADHLD